MRWQPLMYDQVDESRLGTRKPTLALVVPIAFTPSTATPLSIFIHGVIAIKKRAYLTLGMGAGMASLVWSWIQHFEGRNKSSAAF